MTIAYIAHPFSGDVKGNLKKIREIIRNINLTEPDVVPFAPYYADCVAMDDNNPAERERGIRNDQEFFKRGYIDELRVYGPHVSRGMQAEIELANKYHIQIIYADPNTQPF